MMLKITTRRRRDMIIVAKLRKRGHFRRGLLRRLRSKMGEVGSNVAMVESWINGVEDYDLLAGAYYFGR